MAKKKSKSEKKAQRESSGEPADGREEIRIVGRRLTAKDAGWISPRAIVIPVTFTPLDPPEPLPERRSG